MTPPSRRVLIIWTVALVIWFGILVGWGAWVFTR